MPDLVVGGAGDLPTSDKDSWDGSAAKSRIFSWAGWPDNPSSAKAKRAFAIYDKSAPDLKGSYHLPFADVLDGTLTAIKGGVGAAKSRLRQTDAPEDVLDRAESLLNRYWDKMSGEGKSAQSPPTLRRNSKIGETRSTMDVRVSDHVDGFTGYASTWWVVDSYGTAMAPKSFTKTLKERDVSRVPFLFNHNPDAAVGKHIELREDKQGLYINVGIADDGAEGTVLMKRLRFGVPLGNSFGFKKMRSRPATDDDPLDFSLFPDIPRGEVEVYTENAYWESSAVTFPANEKATINTVRSVEEQAAISTLLEDLQSGALRPEDDRWTVLQTLVDAYQERAAAGALVATTAPDPETARRRTRDIEIAIAVGQSHGWLGAHHA